jgi:hypothetical protein
MDSEYIVYLHHQQSPEAICVQLFTEVKRHRPSIIYVPNIHVWWHAVSDMVRNTFINLLNDIHPYDPILLLATSDVLYEDLPSEVQQLFRHCMLGRWLLGNASKVCISTKVVGKCSVISLIYFPKLG